MALALTSFAQGHCLIIYLLLVTDWVELAPLFSFTLTLCALICRGIQKTFTNSNIFSFQIIPLNHFKLTCMLDLLLLEFSSALLTGLSECRVVPDVLGPMVVLD